MSSDWVHCNSCTTLPSAEVQFVFTSCGHVVCRKCFTQAGGACPFCKKPAKCVDINRSLKPEIQMLFRNPRDLAAEYMKSMGAVLDFQQANRTRLQKAQREQHKKAMKFVSVAQAEVKKRIETEKKMVAEKNQIQVELENARLHSQKLESLLATRDLELVRLRKANEGIYKSPSTASLQFQTDSDSGLADTPLSSMSFFNAMTSTPINQSMRNSNGSSGRRRSRDRMQEIFAPNGDVPSPIMPAPQLTTPAVLGYKNGRHSSSESSSRRSLGHQDLFDGDEMEIGGGFLEGN